MNSSDARDLSFRGMGTEMLHRAYGAGAEKALALVELESQRLESLLSRFLPESDVSRINAASGIKSEKISSETLEILTRANEFSKLSEGAFDVSVGPLVDLWDYKNSAFVPGGDKINKALELVDYHDIALDEKDKSAKLKRAGQSIDLGGIAKGYASDAFIKIFKEQGISCAFSNIGGNVSTLGVKPDGSNWLVGIRHPRKEALLGAVKAAGEAVVTSGDYERFFIDSNGVRRHHIISPISGYPAQSGLISVTVVAESALDADALSTALFVAGLEKAETILKKCPWAEAVLTDSSLNVYITRGLKKRFESAAEIKVQII